MDTHTKETSASIHIDDAFRLSLERDAGAGMRIVVLPARGQVRQIRPATSRRRLEPAPDPDDDLANATWEDAEWR